MDTNIHTESHQPPRVSIGLAVYNGEKYLEEAIVSILSQTYQDFELIISDNASSDRTEEICRAFAAQDLRIRYSRNPTNIGGANNENLTFKLARGEYFRWAAHDDVLAPELIEKCVEVLEREPSVALCYGKIVKIDGEGNEIECIERTIAASDKPNERFRELYDWFSHDCETTYGLIRADVMRKTDLQKNYTDSDRTLLCEISLYGKFHQIPEKLFYKRYHADMSTQVLRDYRERMVWFDPEFKKKGKIALPHVTQFFHYLRIIWRAPLSMKERLRCYRHMISWLFLYNRWARMINDVIKAGITITQSFRQKISSA